MFRYLINSKAGLCVRPSTKSFSSFNEIRYVGRGRWVTHDMTRYKLKFKVTEVWKLRTWPISKSVFTDMHVIKTLMLNYDTPWQCLHFSWTDFWYSSSSGVTWPSHLGCATFDKRILPLMMSQSLWGLFIVMNETVSIQQFSSVAAVWSAAEWVTYWLLYHLTLCLSTLCYCVYTGRLLDVNTLQSCVFVYDWMSVPRLASCLIFIIDFCFMCSLHSVLLMIVSVESSVCCVLYSRMLRKLDGCENT